MTTRQTRRNTVALASSHGTLAMDPWQDDRFRDFIAVNVIARVRAFHRRPLQQPLDTRALVGAQNQQRAQNLLVLPPSETFCDGTALDCPVRRMYSRIFGPTLLHHQSHEHAAPRALNDKVGRVDEERCSGADTGTNRLDTPLHPTRSDGDTPAIRVEEQSRTNDNDGSAAVDQIPAARSLFETDASSAGEGDRSTAVNGKTTERRPADHPSMCDVSAADAPVPQRASSASLAAVATAGSATPLDYHAEVDCACCDACCEAIAQHYQQLLNKGVVAERFSVKELLFAHWVIFRNMDGPGMDAHSSSGRKEGLSITMKSGYYGLLKVPKVEDDTSSSPPLGSVSRPAPSTRHASAPPSSSAAVSMPPPLPVGRAPEASSNTTGAGTRKRRRTQETDTQPTVDDTNEIDTAAKPRLLGELQTKTYSTRRAVAQSQARDASISSQPPGDSHSRQATAPPSPHTATSKRAGTSVKADWKAPAPPLPLVSPSASSQAALLFRPVVKEEEPPPPPHSSPNTVAATPIGAPPPPFVVKRTAATAGAQAQLRQSVHVVNTIVPLDNRAAVRLANLKSKVEQQAYERLVEEQLFPTVSSPLSCDSLGRGGAASPPSQGTATTTIATVATSSTTAAAPSSQVFSPADERSLLAVAATASSERRLSRFTFGQQCLLMLAADRIMRPSVVAPPLAATARKKDSGAKEQDSGTWNHSVAASPMFDYWTEQPR